MQEKEILNTSYYFSEIKLSPYPKDSSRETRDSEAYRLPYPYPKKMTLRHRVASFFHRVSKWWDKAKKRFLLQHNVWRSGNLLILLMTFSVLAFTLAFSVGSVLTVGILPVWGLILLLGGALLVLWNIGALYQARLKQLAAYPPLVWDEPLLEENREEAQYNVWEQDDLSFPLVQEIPEKNGSYPPSDEETSNDKTRQNTVVPPIYLASAWDEIFLKAYGGDNESKSSEQREPCSLLNTPPNRSPATSDEEISDDERGQNALRHSVYPASEDDELLIRTYLEDEHKPYDLSISFIQEIPQLNRSPATLDDETSYEETSNDDTCQNTFQLR